MKKEKAEKIIRVYNWVRLGILAAFFIVVYVALT